MTPAWQKKILDEGGFFTAESATFWRITQYLGLRADHAGGKDISELIVYLSPSVALSISTEVDNPSLVFQLIATEDEMPSYQETVTAEQQPLSDESITESVEIAVADAQAASSWLYADDFLRRVGSESENTEKTYERALRLFADWVQAGGHDGYSSEQQRPLNPNRLTTATLKKYHDELAGRWTSQTVTTYMAAILGYLNDLEAARRLPTGMVMGELRAYLRQRNKHANVQASKQVLNMDDVRTEAIPNIVRYYDDLPLPPSSTPDPYKRRLNLLRDRAIVNLLYSSAMRISELPPLNKADVGHGQRDSALIVGKGNKPRLIHIRPYAQKAIQVYLAERTDKSPALFVKHRGQYSRLAKRTLQAVVETAVKKLGLEGISAHDFRHFRATQLLRGGMPLHVVQEMLGHADPSTTRTIYAPVLGETVVRQWLDNLDISPSEAMQ